MFDNQTGLVNRIWNTKRRFPCTSRPCQDGGVDDDIDATGRRIAHILRERIITGEIDMGDKLGERDLAEELGVSRVPVREALHVLEAEGFVSSAHRRAAVVHRFTVDDARELFDMRMHLEPLAAALAAERAAAGADTAALRAALDVAHVASVAAASASSRNSDLHDEIFALAGHALLSRMSGLLTGRTRWLFRLTPERDTPGRWDEHAEMVEAIVGGHVSLARTLAAAHVERARVESMPGLVERLPPVERAERRRRSRRVTSGA
jgi:DNA-binding GntR family transcriptional regulator